MKNILKLSFILLLFSFKSNNNTFEIKDNELIIPYPIVFKAGTAELSPESDTAFNYIRDYLNEKSFITKIRIESHTDTSGDLQRNLALSEKRAMAIGRSLVAKDIDCNRIICVGFGGVRPRTDNETASPKLSNDRISIMNAAMRGVPINHEPIDGGGKVAGNVCNH